MNEKHLGMGVMLNLLSGNAETVDAVKASLGKTIETISLEDKKLRIRFSDGTTLTLWDDGQSCCESRYMKTDDDLTNRKGEKLVNLELREAPDVPTESYGEHEVQFLLVTTNLGVLSFANHNEHNGYYGGFAIKASLSES